MNLSRKFTLREKILLCILAVIILAAGYYFFVQSPVSEAVSTAREEKAALEDELLILEAQAAVQDKMLASLEKLGDAPTVETPEYDNLRLLMDFLNQALSTAEDYELSFEGVSGSEDSSIIRRSVEMTFTAKSYAAAKNIITGLNNCPYRCIISDLQLLPVEENGEEELSLTDGKVSVSLSITFFEKASE